MAGGLLAVVTAVPFWGIAALVAVLVPFLSGSMALFLRRWLILLTINGLASVLYLAVSWYGGYLQATGFEERHVFWFALGLLAVVGAGWSWQRHQRAKRAGTATLLFPCPAEWFVLWAAGLAAVIATCYGIGNSPLDAFPWRGLMAIAVIAWTGALHAAYLCWRGVERVAPAWLPTTECLMLAALALAAIPLGALDPRPAVGPGPQVVWLFEPMERGAIISSPLVDGDRVYVHAIRDQGLNPTGVTYCLDARTGAVLWHFDDDGGMQHGFSSPRLANGLLYVGEGMHANYLSKLYCLEAGTGRKRWHFEAAGHVESTPCLARGKVYFGAGDDGLHGLDALTGQRRWHFQGSFHVDSSPVVVGQRLYAGSGVSRRCKATEAFCLDADTGHVIWRTPTRLPVWGSPRVAAEQVFFGLSTGRLERSADPGEKPAGALLCLDATTGHSLWNYAVSEGVFGKPATDDQCVYFGARNGWCHCLDRRSGELRWQVQLGSPIVNDLVLMDGRLYVVPVGGQACCLNAATGDVLWSWDVAAVSQTRPRIYSSPTVVSVQEGDTTVRRIYFGTELRSPISSTAVLYCLQD